MCKICNCLNKERIQNLFFSDFCNSLLVKITIHVIIKRVILIGKNHIQILFQHTVTLIYTTTKLVLFTTSNMVPMTDVNPGRLHVTRHEIYTLIPNALNSCLLIFIFVSTYLLVYFYLIILFLSGYYCQLLLSCIKVYFCAWLHEVIPNSNLY